MATWDMGYHSELLYTTGYYREISPVFVRYLLTTQGYDMPELNENFCACELGFGQGVSINMHAAATNIKWYGTDFNPTQVNFAHSLANAAKLTEEQISLHDDAFGDFAARTDLPQFDFICLHGIWSWISPENQQIIVDFIRDRLKIGGVLYISYNVGPGFTAFEPVRHLMKSLDDNFHSSATEPITRLHDISEFCNALFKVNPRYAASVPGLRDRLNNVLNKDFHYISGEYLNEHWDIRHFDSMVKELERAKLSFACSATLSELIDSINLTKEQQAFLAPYRGTIFGEVVRDFIVSQQFRRDIFIKGPRRLSPTERSKRLNQQMVCLNVPFCEVGYSFKAALGTAELKRETYEPIYKVLSDHNVHSIESIKEKLKDQVSADQIDEAVMILISQGYVTPCQKPHVVTKQMRERCQRLNDHLLSPDTTADIEFLTSPVVGGGVYITALSRMLMRMRRENPKITNKEIIDILVERLKQQDKGLQIKDQEIKDPKEIRKHLEEHLKNFDQDYMAFYKNLGTIA